VERRSGLLSDKGAEVHAATQMRERRIFLDPELRGAELRRIVVHELFHFIWLRLGNPARREWEALLMAEKARGELGWSSEWRKRELTPRDRLDRSRKWREYACESFCDTAAWAYAGLTRHDEFTLGLKARGQREAWFRRLVERSEHGLRL
jgi:hypothetical protein